MKQYNILNDVVLKPDASGVDLNMESQPMDWLDRACLDYIKEQIQYKPNYHALDYGGGAGKHSIRMAQLGARVTLVDRQDPSHNIHLVEEKGVIQKGLICLIQKDFTDVQIASELTHYDLIYSQRALNYLPYEAFLKVMGDLIQSLPNQGRFYISVSGYDTEFAVTMPTREKPLPERYGYLGCEEMKKKHKIYGQTLVFKLEELTEILIGFGMKILEEDVTTFKNIKIVAEKL